MIKIDLTYGAACTSKISVIGDSRLCELIAACMHRRVMQEDHANKDAEEPRAHPCISAWLDSASAQNLELVIAAVPGPLLAYDWVDELNISCRNLGIPWLRVGLPSAEEIQVGPYFKPHVGACGKCFAYTYLCSKDVRI